MDENSVKSKSKKGPLKSWLSINIKLGLYAACFRAIPPPPNTHTHPIKLIPYSIFRLGLQLYCRKLTQSLFMPLCCRQTAVARGFLFVVGQTIHLDSVMN